MCQHRSGCEQDVNAEQSASATRRRSVRVSARVRVRVHGRARARVRARIKTLRPSQHITPHPVLTNLARTVSPFFNQRAYPTLSTCSHDSPARGRYVPPSHANLSLPDDVIEIELSLRYQSNAAMFLFIAGPFRAKLSSLDRGAFYLPLGSMKIHSLSPPPTASYRLETTYAKYL